MLCRMLFCVKRVSGCQRPDRTLFLTVQSVVQSNYFKHHSRAHKLIVPMWERQFGDQWPSDRHTCLL